MPKNASAKSKIAVALGEMATTVYRPRVIRGGGNSPDDWGRSPQCRKMVRKNRLIRIRNSR